MARRGTPFVGVLYVGLALTSRGPRVIEFNVRFGDPETEPLLSLLESPLASIMLAAAQADLSTIDGLRFRPEYAVGVVLASQGYPSAPITGRPHASGGGASAPAAAGRSQSARGRRP